MIRRILFLLPAFVMALLALAQSTAAQAPDASGVKAMVDEAFRVRDESSKQFAQGQTEEGQKLAEQSAQLFRDARQAYDAMGAGESKDVAVLVDYARLLNEMEDFDLSERALLRAAALAPGDAAVWLQLGQTQAALGPASESRAIRSLRNAAEIEPTSKSTVEAHASLGALYQQGGLYQFARESFNEALKLDPDHIGSRLTVASLDAREGKMFAAAEAFDSIEALSPEHGPYIKRTLGPALEEFAASRRWLPDTAEEHFAYAKLLVRVDRIEDSVWPLLRSLRIDDKNYAALNLMGSVYRGLDRLRGAREAFTRSLELNPDQPRTRQALDELDAIEREKPGSTTFPEGTRSGLFDGAADQQPNPTPAPESAAEAPVPALSEPTQ